MVESTAATARISRVAQSDGYRQQSFRMRYKRRRVFKIDAREEGRNR